METGMDCLDEKPLLKPGVYPAHVYYQVKRPSHLSVDCPRHSHSRLVGQRQSGGSDHVLVARGEPGSWLWTCACVQTCVLRCFSRVRLFETLWTAVHQTPLSMGFSRQENQCVAVPFSRGSS